MAIGSEFEGSSRRAIARTLREFARPTTWIGLTLVVLDWAQYVFAMTAIFLFQDGWVKIFGSIFAGIKLSQFLVLAHDAAHGSLIKSIKGNKALAVICFLPILYNYRLWIYDHHLLHHPHTNENHADSYTPISKSHYDSLGVARRALIRFYRAPNLMGFGIYYLIERWWVAKLFPRKFLPKAYRASAWRHFYFIAIYLLALIGALVTISLRVGMSPLAAILLGWVLPYYVFMTLVGLTLYAQHTNSKVPWFRQGIDRTRLPEELVSVTLFLPRWMSLFMHHPFYHTVHHVNPRVPCYRYPAAHRALSVLLGGRQVECKMTVPWLFETQTQCKLYDFDNQRWTDYDGLPTAPPIAWAKDLGEVSIGESRNVDP